jgi:hypothetical protein
LGVKASPADSTQLADENVEKPWYILRGFSATVTRQRQKIPLIFRKFRAEVSIEEIHKGPESGVASSSLAPWGIWNDQPVSHGKGILATNAFHGNAVEGGGQDFNVPSLGDRMHRRDSNGKVRKGTAFMAKSSLGEEENLVGLSVIEDTQCPASRAGGPRHETQCDEITQKMPGQAYEPFSPVAGSAGESWQTEESSHNYQPRPQTKDRTDSTEFVSSAIMIRCPNGEQDSAKMFYDTMSTDNIVSRKFVEKYGFIERPFHPDDLKVYDTLVGAFAPTHYVEIELKDTERDIKEFTKVSFNVAESMNGIGLLAGREFMIKHGVSLNAKEGPGAFVVTSREADEGKQSCLQNQRAILTRLLRCQKSTKAAPGSDRDSYGKGKGVCGIRCGLLHNGIDWDESGTARCCLFSNQYFVWRQQQQFPKQEVSKMSSDLSGKEQVSTGSEYPHTYNKLASARD